MDDRPDGAGTAWEAAAPSLLMHWLSIRAREPAASRPVGELIGRLGAIRGRAGSPEADGFSRRWGGGIAARLGCIAALHRAAGPGAGAGPARRRWARMAEQLADRWPVGGTAALIELSEAGNGLVLASLSAALREAVDPGACPRPALAALERLRQLDEASFRDLGVPPAPGAPLDPGQYLSSPGGSGRIEAARGVLAALGPTGGCPADDTPLAALGRAIADWDDGWPVPVDGLRSAARGLAESIGEGGGRLRELLEAIGRPDPGEGIAAPAAGPGAGRRGAARGPLTALADRLDGEAAPEARGLAARLREVGGGGPEDERLRRAAGCLLALDELLDRPGRIAWAARAHAELLAICRSWRGFEVIDEAIVGTPAARVAGEVAPVAVAPGPPSGDPGRITGVPRCGYAIRLPDGTRHLLRRAEVVISP